jgi:pantetheine-phosphate adenylyltransferase
MAVMAKTAFFPGSFDPPTNGHVDLLEGALDIADRVIVGVGVNSQKAPLFSAEMRAEMLGEIVESLGDGRASRVSVASYHGLLVDAVRKAGADFIIRGIRDAGDIGAEFRMAAMNSDLAPGLRTIFLPSSAKHRHISATLVRQIAEMSGNVAAFVPDGVARRLAELH